MVEPSLKVIEVLTEQIKELALRIGQISVERYPATMRLRQITGIGPITALTYVLVIGDKERFAASRDVGAYLGLVPKRDQSGKLDKQLRISKAGDAYLRCLLVSAAQYAIGPFGQPCDLRTHGLKLAERGGRGAKKKAVIAIARKLAVVIHTLLMKDYDYEPCRPEKVAA